MTTDVLPAWDALGIDWDRLWSCLPLEASDRDIVCQLLLGFSRQEIAVRWAAQRCQCSEADLQAALERIKRDEALIQQASPQPLTKAELRSRLPAADQALKEQFESADRQIRDRLSGKIYPSFAALMQVPRETISGNWVKMLNFLYDPQNGYRLHPPIQLNSDNFQGSLGRQVFLPPLDRAIAQAQHEGTRFYQRGLYYQAFHAFAAAWRQEQATVGRGNPEILIYLNNCLIELYGDRLRSRNLQSYLVAVVVPFHHNQGQVATEVLRGVAQLQWQTNWRCLQRGGCDRDLDSTQLPSVEVGAAPGLGQPLALKVMVVNDPNHVYDADNPTAERLAALAPELNLMAVIGHYSSEMTEKALPFYALQGLPLINASSTSDGLTTLSAGLQPSFFRLTTPDRDNATALMTYLAARGAATAPPTPQRMALIYNRNSQYCLSYRGAVQAYLAAHRDQFTLAAECDRISDQPEPIHRFLQTLEAQNANLLLVIPDGGIEPNSLNNAGIISRLNLKTCLMAGSATFYQDNVLHWMYERDRPKAGVSPAIVACVPWHPNGKQTTPISTQFCQFGRVLWGTGPLTWRSAIAYDALLMLQTVLARWPCADRTALLRQLNHDFRVQRKPLQGITGAIEFRETCDRLHPPTEIVTVKPDPAQHRWIWDLADHFTTHNPSP
jgi:branched-chain amino acid transport system substrate-binding protein